MADITKRLFLRHLRSTPTAHIQRVKNGRIVDEGTGRSFWFRPLTSAISELPIEEQERPLLFRARTADFQEVAVQATITYRISDPGQAASRIDFSIDTSTGRWRATPLEQLGGILTELAQQHAVAVLAGLTLTEVMASGIPQLRQAVSAGLRADEWLTNAGIEVIGVRVISVRPEAEIEKALQNPVREQLQQESDRATYERRARAVEQERAISENELRNRIELARREAELVSQEGANDRSRATEAAAADRIRTASDAEGIEVMARAEAEGARVTGAAGVEVERAKLEAYAAAGEATLLALAAQELARNLPSVDTLVVTPELLSSLLARLAVAGGGGGAGAAEIEARR